MTDALVIVAHPNTDSFSHALARAAAAGLVAEGFDVAFRDLYAEGFDPVLRADETLTTRDAGDAALTAGGDPLVVRHRRELAVVDTLVVAHPNWWGKPPAIMAGWIDRVVVPGVAYRLSEASGEPEPLLRLRNLVVLNTGDTPPEREREVFGDPLDAIWRRCIGSYLGDAAVSRLVAGPMAGATAQQRERWLQAARLAVARPPSGSRNSTEWST